MSRFQCMRLHAVPKSAVDYWESNALRLSGRAPGLPAGDRSEWNRDHAMFIVCRVLPLQDLPRRVRRIAIEAYLAGGEAYSDGSSIVPDSLRYGYTKDWQGVVHDYIFYLKHWGLKDADGHEWGFREANEAYRVMWQSDGQKLRGNTWFAGLMLGAWPVWREYTEAEKKSCDGQYYSPARPVMVEAAVC